MAEHLKEKIHERAPSVDLIVGPDGYRRLADHLVRAEGGEPCSDTVLDRHETYEGLDPARGDDGGVIGRVTIQRGCDKFCTFCVVPYTRGRERGVAPREILRQVRALAAAGYKEVQLLGQTVNSYRYEDVGLRRAADRGGGGRGHRAGALHLALPARFLPGGDRGHGRLAQDLQTRAPAAADRLGRRACAHAARVHLRRVPGAGGGPARGRCRASPSPPTSWSGFCDETEDEFAAILRAQEELRFDGAFMFAYSEREGTYAARKMPDTVPEAVKQRRLAEAIAAAAAGERRDQRRPGGPARARAGRGAVEALGADACRVAGAHRHLPLGDRAGRAGARAGGVGRRRHRARQRRHACSGAARGGRRRELAAGATPVRLSFVCLGNICRSPTAEAVMRHLSARRR